MQAINLKSNRLVLRPFNRCDRDDLFAYLSREDVVKFEPYSVQSYDECTHMALVREREPEFIAIALGPRMIGNLYFAPRSEASADFELGYILNPEFEGQGYATEACKCLISHAFCEMNAKRIYSYCNPDNTKSRQLLVRIGMKCASRKCLDSYFKFDECGKIIWQDTYEYCITRHRFGGLQWE